MTKKITLQQRINLYNSSQFGFKYPKSVLKCIDDFVFGVWMLGNDYHNKSKLYGAYPPRYLDRVGVMFPGGLKTMHLFSGSLPAGEYVRVDLNGGAGVVKQDAQGLSKAFKKRSFDMIYADPPYSKADAVHYGLPMINRTKVLEECALVLKPGGFVVWLDTMWPLISKTSLKLVGVISIYRSCNHRVRSSFIYRKP
jgi:SAM-dependent methyltransferase